MVVPLSYL
jgi:hypothetical protein